MAINRRFSTLLCLMLGLTLFGSAKPALAHGSEVHLVDNVLVGPYLLSVRALPNPVTTGRMLLAADIYYAQNMTPAKDCELLFQVAPQTGFRSPVQAIGVQQSAAAEYGYEAELVIEDPGGYRGVVLISDSSGWSGEIPFEFEAIAVYPWVKGIVYLMLIQAVIFGLWLVTSIHKVWIRKYPQFQNQAVSIQGGSEPA